MMIISDGKMKKNEDWGIHVESDCLAELSALVAGQMEQDGVVNAEYLALIFAFFLVLIMSIFIIVLIQH